MATTRKQVLDGQTVILTRPYEGAIDFADMLRAEGATVTFLPTIKILPLDLTPALVASIQAALHENRYKAVIFTSARAVACFTAITQPEHRLVRAYSVGPKTSAALGEIWGGPIEESTKARAEGLVELITRQPVSPTPYLFPCSTLARPTLEQGLKARGHRVERLELYQTLPIETWTEPAPALPKNCWVVLASPSAAIGLAASGIDLAEAQLACIGPTTQQAAISVGLHVAVVATKPSAHGLCAAIAAGHTTG